MTDAANYHREGLDPVAQARSWKAMAKEHNLTTHKAIVEKAKVRRVGKVSAHLRPLDLPEGVQRYFEEGILSLDAEPRLRELQERSAPALARRRHSLIEKLEEVERPDPVADRRAALDIRISSARNRSDSLARRRS